MKMASEIYSEFEGDREIESPLQHLVTKPNSTSKVWWFFGFVPNGIGIPANTNKAMCKLCASPVSCKGGNTSNLFTHLRIHHRDIHSQLKVQASNATGSTATTPTSSSAQPLTVEQSAADSILQPSATYCQRSKKWKTLTDAVARCMAKELMPFRLVESPAFSDLLRAFDSGYELPTSKYMSNTVIPTLYEQTRAVVASELQQAEHFSATVESMEQYLCYTVHFIGADWKLHSRYIHTLFFHEDHRGSIFAEAIPTVLEPWGLAVEKQICVTSDASVAPASSLLLSCFGNNLQAAVTSSMKDDRSVNQALGVCRKLVSTFCHNWRKRIELTRAQVDHGLPYHSLVADNTTQWGSQQIMIDRILEQESALCQVLSSHLLPSWRDIDVLRSVKRALDPLREFVDVLLDKNYVMVSAIKPLLQHMREEILIKAEGDSQLTLDIKHRVMLYMECKYADPAVSMLLGVATFLDPRFRTDYIDKTDLVGVREKIASEAREEQPQTSAVEQSSQEIVPPTKKRKLSDILKKSKGRVSISSVTTPVEAIQQEIERYLQVPQPDVDSDPLDWWRMNESIHPSLAKLARKYLCICATSKTAERVFSSTSDGDPGGLGSCVNPDEINMQVFLAKNL